MAGYDPNMLQLLQQQQQQQLLLQQQQHQLLLQQHQLLLQQQQQQQQQQQLQPQQQQVPVCYHCKQVITESYLIAFNLSWHYNHIACKVCRRTFEAGRAVREGPDGFAYCDPCATVAFAPTCGGCGEKITEGDMLKAADRNWHPEHFACFVCATPFGTTFFPTEDGKLYCEKHYYEITGLNCAECEHPILGGQLIEMGTKKYHLDHFKCKYCKKALADAQYWEKDSHPYCERCHLRLFG